MSLGPIPVTAIHAWCETHWRQLDYDAAMLLTHVILQLDSERAEREARQRALEELSKGNR
jgi:hypothetical protein